MSTRPSSKIVVATSIPPNLSRRDAGAQVGFEYQDLCVRSWLECGFHVMSVNDGEEIPPLRERYPDIHFVPTERNASRLTGRKNPYIADLLGVVANSDASAVGIINSDIVFQPSRAWADWLPVLAGRVATLGQRQDTTSILHGALRNYYWGFDYFFFDHDTASTLAKENPPYVMGVPWWDYWLPFALYEKGQRVLIADRPAIIHLAHEVAWKPDLAREMAVHFARFVVETFGQSPEISDPQLVAIVDACRKLVAVPDEVARHVEAVALVQRLNDSMAANFVPFLRKNVVQFAEDAMGEPKWARELRQPVAGSQASLSGADQKYTPQKTFAHFDQRMAGARALLVAEQLVRQGKRVEAEAAYRDALAQLPSDPETAFHAGVFFLENKNISMALPLFKRAVGVAGDDPRYQVGLGTALGAVGQTKEAIGCFEKAIAADPRNAVAHFNLALALDTQGRRQEGFRRFEQALDDHPDFPDGPEWYFRLRRNFQIAGKPTAPDYYGQRGEDAILDEFFGFKNAGFFVDVGAFDGIHLSNSYVFERRGWTGICVEAAPQYYELCAKNRPGSRCVHAACGAEEGRVDLRFEPGGLFSGIGSDAQAVSQVFARVGAQFQGFQSINVPMTTLNRLLESHSGPIDFLSLDVEGHEIDVLKGLDLKRYRPNVLLIEANTTADREALDTYLASHGYRHARANGWNHFYVATEDDRQKLRAIVMSAKLACPQHPLGEGYKHFGYPENPYIYRGVEKESA